MGDQVKFKGRTLREGPVRDLLRANLRYGYISENDIKIAEAAYEQGVRDGQECVYADHGVRTHCLPVPGLYEPKPQPFDRVRERLRDRGVNLTDEFWQMFRDALQTEGIEEKER